jgi:Mg2+ and Co2+ transporter CorA
MSAVQVANLIASTFGMNLDQNKAKGSFVTVFIFSGVVITIVYSVAYIYLARLGVVYSRSQLSADKKYSIRWS